MLEMRPDCESCGEDLPADKTGAHICSFECTFCDACNRDKHKGTCPNCGGDLVMRPTRSAALLKKFPASTIRKYNG